MPAIFLHSIIAYIANRWNPKLSLPGLLVGSMFPDLEVIPIYFLTNGAIDRLIFHSIIGAITLGTIFTLGFVVFVYPKLISIIFRIDENEIKNKSSFSITLIISSVIGNLSHVIIDATTHEFNPLLYPLVNGSIDFLRISSNRFFDNLGVSIILFLILIVIVSASLKNGRGSFWKKMLVDQNYHSPE